MSAPLTISSAYFGLAAWGAGVALEARTGHAVFPSGSSAMTVVAAGDTFRLMPRLKMGILAREIPDVNAVRKFHEVPLENDALVFIGAQVVFVPAPGGRVGPPCLSSLELGDEIPPISVRRRRPERAPLFLDVTDRKGVAYRVTLQRDTDKSPILPREIVTEIRFIRESLFRAGRIARLTLESIAGSRRRVDLKMSEDDARALGLEIEPSGKVRLPRRDIVFLSLHRDLLAQARRLLAIKADSLPAAQKSRF